jgi:hypothetical protein
MARAISGSGEGRKERIDRKSEIFQMKIVL